MTGRQTRAIGAMLLLLSGAAFAAGPQEQNGCAAWAVEGLWVGMDEALLRRHVEARGWNTRETGRRLAWHEPPPAGRHPGTNEMGGSLLLRDGVLHGLRLTYRGEGPARAGEERSRLEQRWGPASEVGDDLWRWIDDECGISVEVLRQPAKLSHWDDPWVLHVHVKRTLPPTARCHPEPVAVADRRPSLIPASRTSPQMPDRARRQKGWTKVTVMLEIVVEPDGTVGDIRVLKAPEPDLGFVDAAIAAVKKWRYHPALCNGKPVSFRMPHVTTFEIQR